MKRDEKRDTKEKRSADERTHIGMEAAGRMRLQKLLAQAGVASRRRSEEIIAEGRVRVNGQVVREMGVSVDPAADRVEVDGRPVSIGGEYIYIMLNKPCGCVSTCSDDRGRPTVMDYIKGIRERVYPVGRLDFTTEGLLLLTNDGALANRLTHPSHEAPKRYLVILDSAIDEDDVKKLERGVMLEDGKTAPAKVKVLKSAPDRAELTMVIHEGRNRQVRRMLEALGKNVVFLKRISVGDLNLGDLKKGAYRHLTAEEVAHLRSF